MKFGNHIAMVTFRLSYRSNEPITLSLPEQVEMSQNLRDFNKGICIAEIQSMKLNSSEIISALAPQVDTIRFEEIIPSMNDIFIKSVEEMSPFIIIALREFTIKG